MGVAAPVSRGMLVKSSVYMGNGRTPYVFGTWITVQSPHVPRAVAAFSWNRMVFSCGDAMSYRVSFVIDCDVLACDVTFAESSVTIE